MANLAEKENVRRMNFAFMALEGLPRASEHALRRTKELAGPKPSKLSKFLFPQRNKTTLSHRVS